MITNFKNTNNKEGANCVRFSLSIGDQPDLSPCKGTKKESLLQLSLIIPQLYLTALSKGKITCFTAQKQVNTHFYDSFLGNHHVV